MQLYIIYRHFKYLFYMYENLLCIIFLYSYITI